MKGYRTLAFSLAVAAIGVLQSFDWATVVPPGWVGPVLTGIGVLSAMLRAMTTTPLGAPPPAGDGK